MSNEKVRRFDMSYGDDGDEADADDGAYVGSEYHTSPGSTSFSEFVVMDPADKKAAQKAKKTEKQRKKAAEVNAAAAAAAAFKAKADSAAIYAELVAKLKRGETVPDDVRTQHTCEFCGQLDFPPHNNDRCERRFDAQIEASTAAMRRLLDAAAAPAPAPAPKGGYRTKSHKKRRSHKKHKSHKKRRTHKTRR